MNHVKDVLTLQHVISLVMQLSEDDRRQLLRYVREHTPYEEEILGPRAPMVLDDEPSPLAKGLGQWPGDETDEEMFALLTGLKRRPRS